MHGLGCDEINLCIELSQVWNLFFWWLPKVSTRVGRATAKTSPKKWTHFAGKHISIILECWLQTQFLKDRNIRPFGVAHQWWQTNCYGKYWYWATYTACLASSPDTFAMLSYLVCSVQFGRLDHGSHCNKMNLAAAFATTHVQLEFCRHRIKTMFVKKILERSYVPVRR